MRTLIGSLVVVVVVSACVTAQPAPREPMKTAEAPPPPVAPAEPAPEVLTADTTKQTPAGNTFIAPAGWTVRTKSYGLILEPPEGGSALAIIDVKADDAQAAIAAGWKLFREGGAGYPIISTMTAADTDGWSHLTFNEYDVPPNIKRRVRAAAHFANGGWTVIVDDFDRAVRQKRGSQLSLVFERLMPKGVQRETFAGKPANTLDAARIEQLRRFIEDAEKATGVPGVSFGLIQNGKVVFSGGVGVRELGKPAKVDGDTKYMIASNTKGLVTLMLAKQVDAGKFRWDTPVKELLPSFKLASADVTDKIQVKHLICACTGMPRQDMEWVFQFDGVTPEKTFDTLATMQPTSGFGELFQYSNPLAAAAGYIGGHVANPKLAFGPAFDQAMQSLIFTPLKMTSTTFDFAKGQAGNAAVPHAVDLNGKTQLALAKLNTSIIPLRPAGGAWSTANDLLKYVQMELNEGVVDGKQYIGKEALLERRKPQVSLGANADYAMALEIDHTYGVPVVHHGGSMIGFFSDMIWLPEQGVGAVVLTNGDPGWIIREAFRRKLLEVLFDGRPEADATVKAEAKSYFDDVEAWKKLLTSPADPAQIARLAKSYSNAALGGLKVEPKGAITLFDFGEYKAEVATRVNTDGSVSFVTITPGAAGDEFVAGEKDGKRTLTTRDNQHEYVFIEN